MADPKVLQRVAPKAVPMDESLVEQKVGKRAAMLEN